MATTTNSENITPFTKTVYCTACSTQTGAKKRKVEHENMVIAKKDIKPTRKLQKSKSGETEIPPVTRIVGYVAVLQCPVKNRSISTFIHKSKAREILGITEEEEQTYFDPQPEENGIDITQD